MRNYGFVFLCLSCLAIFCCTTNDNSTPPVKTKPIIYGDKGPGKNKWTFMVYMAADNSLDSLATPDLNEMELVSLANEGVNVIVLCDRNATHDYYDEGEKWQGTRLYEIKADNRIIELGSTRLSADLGDLYPKFKLSATGDNDELNMGDPDTLAAFITWCRINYDATTDYYGLILWNHGSGWILPKKYRPSSSPTPTPTTSPGPTEGPLPVIQQGICEDASNKDMLTLKEVETAIVSAMPPNKPLELVGMDACLMSMAETAYQLSGEAECLVASELLEPGEGWDYTEFLAGFIQLQDNSPQKVGQCIVDAYRRFGDKLPATAEITLACVNLNMMPDFMIRLNNFSNALAASDQGAITVARHYTPVLDDTSCIDLTDFVNHFTNINGANELLGFLNDPNFLYFTQKNASALNGLAIYFPEGLDWYYSDYATYIIVDDNPFISFPKVSNWDDFLIHYHDYLQSTYHAPAL